MKSYFPKKPRRRVSGEVKRLNLLSNKLLREKFPPWRDNEADVFSLLQSVNPLTKYWHTITHNFFSQGAMSSEPCCVTTPTGRKGMMKFWNEPNSPIFFLACLAMLHFPQVGSLLQFPEYDILIRHISIAEGSKLREKEGEGWGVVSYNNQSECFRFRFWKRARSK